MSEFHSKEPHLIPDKVQRGGEGPADSGEVVVQDGRADHEVRDGGDAGEGGHSPVDAAAWKLMNINFICSLPHSCKSLSWKYGIGTKLRGFAIEIKRSDTKHIFLPHCMH